MKSKNGRNVAPAKEQEAPIMKKTIQKDEIDDIIEIVVRWIQPGRDLSELNNSIFYGLVRKKIKGIIRKIKQE